MTSIQLDPFQSSNNNPDLTVASMQSQMDVIQVYIDHFLSTIKNPAFNQLLPRSPVLFPEECETDTISLQGIEVKLLRLLLERLTAVFKLTLLSQQHYSIKEKGHPNESETVESLAKVNVSNLVYIALMRILEEKIDKKFDFPTINSSKFSISRKVLKNKFETHIRRPVRPPSRKLGVLVNPPLIGLPDADLSSATYDCSSRELSESPQILPGKKFLRSRTRTISRLQTTDNSKIDKMKQLELENEILRKNELILLSYSDPYGPCSTRPSGNAKIDMKMQIIANQLRVQLLEKQSGQLNRMLELMKPSQYNSPDVEKSPVEFLTRSMFSHSTSFSSETQIPISTNFENSETQSVATTKSAISISSTLNGEHSSNFKKPLARSRMVNECKPINGERKATADKAANSKKTQQRNKITVKTPMFKK